MTDDFIFNCFFRRSGFWVFGWTFQRFLATLGWCKCCLIHNSKSQSPSCALGNNPKLLRIGFMYGIFTFIYHTNQAFIDRKKNPGLGGSHGSVMGKLFVDTPR